MVKDLKKYLILVIEDNLGDFILINDYLEEQIPLFELKHANNFTDAASLIKSKAHNFDVILLDLTLPDKFGEELITETVSLAGKTPVIILTGYGDIDFSIRALSLGVTDYLVKEDINSTLLYKSIVYNIERKKINKELLDSNKRYKDLFYLSPQPKWLLDASTNRFIQVNQSAINLYGYSEEEFLNMSIFDIKSQNQDSLKNFFHNNSANEIKSIRVKHQKKSKELIEVDIHISPFPFNDKIYRLLVVVDVTAKVLLENKITRAIIKTQEDERYEIGGELHDNVCQILATSLLSLRMIEENIPENKKEWFYNTEKYINLAAGEIRNLSHQLAPAFFNETKLEDAFKMLLKSFNLDGKFAISLSISKNIPTTVFTREIQLNLYRILQEQLRNILKYAQAAAIGVSLFMEKNYLKMQITDNGIGFNIGETVGGIGFANMKRRAELFNGSIQIDSSPGKGCSVSVLLPFEESCNNN